MYDHIFKTWISPIDHTSKWQIFRNKAGFANTNSPLESFNSRLKTDFFKRVVRSIGGFLTIMCDEIFPYLSINCKKFLNSPRYIENTEKSALKLTKANFSKINKHSYSYKGVNNNCTLKFDLPDYFKSCFCDCTSFMKDGVCMHLVAFSLLFDKDFYKNYTKKDKNFATCKKKGRHAHTKKAGQFN